LNKSPLVGSFARAETLIVKLPCYYYVSFPLDKELSLGQIGSISMLEVLYLVVVLVLGFECCAIRLSYCIAIEQYYVKSCLSSKVELTFSVRGKK
jgi:hypothetical protein